MLLFAYGKNGFSHDKTHIVAFKDMGDQILVSSTGPDFGNN